MTGTRMTLAAGVIWLLCGYAATAQAQRIPGYSSRPTVSPYINLFRGNAGGGLVNNYFSLVRPLQQQEQFNQRQMAQNRFLQQQVIAGNQSMQLGAPAQNAGGPSIQLRPTNQGVGAPQRAASFFNYSHYYGVPTNARRRTR